MRKPMSALVFGIVLALAGCASAQGGGGGSVHRASPTRNSSLITQKELDQYPSQTAYSIVQRLHPEWLEYRTQGIGSNSSSIQVYMGQSHVGGIEELRNYTGAQLGSIQYLDAAHAVMRFGTDNLNGAVVLTLR